MSKRIAPIIQVMRQGNLANQMIQYLVAKKIQHLCPGSIISGIDLPTWHISNLLPYIVFEKQAEYNWHVIPVQHVAKQLNSGELESVALSGYFQRIENFPELDVCREIFPENFCAAPGYDEQHLLINIRANEILSGAWRNYTLVPIDYYHYLINETGLKPVFMGQISDGPYREYLETSFPGARFVPSLGIMEDFHTIRRSKNIVVSVSTFSWLAAWLSQADRVFMPLTGFYNPFQDRDVQLLPLDDSRYRYDLFPINYAVPFENISISHNSMRGSWKRVSPHMLSCMLAQWPRFGHLAAHSYKEAFDEIFYLNEYADVDAAIKAGELATGFEHFFHHGFREKRLPFRLDAAWYSRTYPDAAVEVGRGDFASFQDHFAGVGYMRGYASYPPETT